LVALRSNSCKAHSGGSQYGYPNPNDPYNDKNRDGLAAQELLVTDCVAFDRHSFRVGSQFGECKDVKL
jgi:hypothetical protein